MAKRYAAMEQVARTGILTTSSMMSILPGLCDTLRVGEHSCQKLANVLNCDHEGDAMAGAVDLAGACPGQAPFDCGQGVLDRDESDCMYKIRTAFDAGGKVVIIVEHAV